MRWHLRTPVDLPRRLVEADLATLGERLDVASGRLEGAVVNDRVAEHHRAAAEAHRTADERLRAGDTVPDLQAAVRSVATGRRHLAHVEAYVVGEVAPADAPPCLFDPAHGPSYTEATWTSVRYGTRRVPACLRDAVLLAAGVPPEARTVEVEGRTVPYWAAGDHVAAYLDAYFADHPLLAWLRDPGNPLPRGVRPPPAIYGEANSYFSGQI